MFADLIAQWAAFGPALACGLVLSLTTAATSLTVRHHRATRTDGDQVFWDLFAGAAVAVPAALLPALASPTAGLAASAAGAATGVAAYRSYPRLAALLDARRRRNKAIYGLGAAVKRHQRTVQTWQRYEMDPAMAIDFPGMSDVRQPETAQLIRAMRSAEDVDPVKEPELYSRTVEALEYALEQAESAAGARPRPFTH